MTPRIPYLLLVALALGPAAIAAASPGRAVEAAGDMRLPAGVPVLTRVGPYGDPLAGRPTGSAALAYENIDRWSGIDLPSGSAAARPSSDAAGASAPGQAGPPGVDPDLPPRPGSFGTSPTRLPGILLKSKVVAPHTTPDVEIPLGQRATVGVFGEVSRLDMDMRNVVVPTNKARDLGAGVSLQYRFGQ